MARKKVTKKKPGSDVTESSLLDVAKGVLPPETVIEKKFWDNPPTNKKEFQSYRREARRAVYAIIKNYKLKRPITDPAQIEMQKILTEQLDGNKGLRWDNFTSVWDLHPNDIKKIILKEHWLKEGGGFDLDFGTHYPTAFTGQKIE